MISQNLYELLFSGSNLPKELSDQDCRAKLIEQLSQTIKSVRYQRPLLLQQAGMNTDRLYFVEKGVVRGYTFDHQKEKTISLWLKGYLFTDPNSFLHQIESEIFFEVFAETELSYITRKDLEELSYEFPFIKSSISWLVKNDIKYSNKRLLDKSISAWDRLVEMRRVSPHLEQMVSRTIIASFLNISPQHLSKIVRDNYRK